MLNEVLKLMSQEQSVAVTEMAQMLGWPLQRVESSIAQLEYMGYIRKGVIGSSSCSAGGCSGCSSGKGNACQDCHPSSENLYSWVITERGKRALN